MKQKQRIALFGMVVVALILAACGSDSGNNSSESEGDSSSSAFSSSSTQLSSSGGASSSSSSIEDGTLTYEGQTYRTVTIGTQTWMAENLNYAVDNSWCYENNEDNCAKYGRLYQWTSAMDIDPIYDNTTWGGSDVNHQGICPDGWHLPNNGEWGKLDNYVDANNGDEGIGTSLKSASEWEARSGVATGTDRFGFSALPAGYRHGQYSLFIGTGEDALFWAAVDGNCWELRYTNEEITQFGEDPAYIGSSVRCLKNAE